MPLKRTSSMMGVDCWGMRTRTKGSSINLRAAMAEFVASALFVIIGCGVAMGTGASSPASRLVVAMAFGMSIMVLAYSIGKHSGGQINCAVTWALVLSGHLPILQGLTNVVAQLAGAVAGAIILTGVFPCEMDITQTIGTNSVSPGFTTTNALFAEALGTFLLCYVIFETAVSPATTCGPNACLAIGFTVFLAHLFLLPLTGCSINPTRSTGPAVISFLRRCSNYTEGGLDDLWIFWAGPLMGATFAAIVQRPFLPKKDEVELVEHVSFDPTKQAAVTVEQAAPLSIDDAELAEAANKIATAWRQRKHRTMAPPVTGLDVV